MFAGHFGLAAVVKGKSPETPFWALMLSTQLLDVVFVPLYLSGVETITPADGGGSGYGEHLIHADYTHSLLGALMISLLAGILARRFWGRRAGIVIGSVAFSHWLLDLLVHRADLPLLPGNLGQLPLLGLGLWKFSSVSIVLESVLIIAGSVMYARSFGSGMSGSRKALAITASVLLSGLLVLSLVTDVHGAA